MTFIHSYHGLLHYVHMYLVSMIESMRTGWYDMDKVLSLLGCFNFESIQILNAFENKRHDMLIQSIRRMKVELDNALHHLEEEQRNGRNRK